MSNNFKIRKILSIDEYSQKIQNIEDSRDYLLFTILWETGIRISESLNIRIEHVNFDNRTVNIYSLKKRGEAIRVIPLSQDTLRLIRMFISDRKSGLMFNIKRVQAFNLCKRYFDCSPHDIRHSRAINLLTSGVTIETVRRVLGHSRLDVTQHYLDFDFETMRKEMEKTRGLIVANQESRIV